MTVYGPYPATVVSVHDGDTCRLRIDLGFDLTITYNVRCYGINAPELNTDPGKAAAAYARLLLPAGSKVTVTSHGYDKYGGRIDGDVRLTDGSSWATLMLTSGNAIPYTV